MLAAVREAWQPLRCQWLGERVLLVAGERSLMGLGLRGGVVRTAAWQSLLPAQALVDGMPELVDVLGDFIGDVLLSQGLMGQPVWLALPQQAAQWRVIEWPFEQWPDEPIEALRTIDPDLGLPFALADAAIDLQPLPGRPLRSLLVAAPTALVEAWVQAFSIAGAPLERLIPAQVCSRQALLPRLQQLDPHQGVLLLQPQPQGVIAQLWRQDRPLYERLLRAEGATLAEQLQQLLAFYGSRDPAFAARHLWLAGDLPEPQALASALDLTLEQPDCAPYDSHVMQGLAQLQ